MSKRLWLLIEWVDEAEALPKYGVVNVGSLIGHATDLHPGKYICVRSKHGTEARKAQILKISDNKRSMKEQKSLLDRDDNQMQNMLDLCMDTIKQMKSQSLKKIDVQRTADQMMMAGVSGLNTSTNLPHVIADTDSDTDSEGHYLKQHLADRYTKSLKSARHIQSDHSMSSVFHPHRNYAKGTSIRCSTPMQRDTRPMTMTFDQGTQTDGDFFTSDDIRIIQLEEGLRELYKSFRNLVANLDTDEAYESCKDESEIENIENFEINPELANSWNGKQNTQREAVPRNIEPEMSAKTLEVRRVSAHTTNDGEMIPIGYGHAKVPARIFNSIDWNHYTSATRKLLQAVFPKRVLATHSLTGKSSPAFQDKPAKKQLDPKLTEDIIQTVTTKCNVPKSLVKGSITTKLTDEAKLYRNRTLSMQKKAAQLEQENLPPTLGNPSSSNTD